MYLHYIILIFLFKTSYGNDPVRVTPSSGAVAPDGSARQTWGYVPVRPGAHMFWWLYYTTAAEHYETRPLVLWLQGGPGASGTGFGNFAEIGPLDINKSPRNTSWVHHVNVLFVDNPVGSGFSYVEKDDLFVKNNSEIARDLISLLKGFTSQLPEFQTTPFYIFSESYGGKMAVGLARLLHKEIISGHIKMAFKGIALGDSWISPIDSVNSWSSYLYNLGLVDMEGESAVRFACKQVTQAVTAKNMTFATELFGKAQTVVDTETDGVNFYNILSPVKSISKRVKTGNYLEYLFKRHVRNQNWREDEDEKLTKLMNGEVRDKLRVVPANVTWGGQSDKVFIALAADFMASVADSVEALLNNTQISISVYSGQLDLIVATKGTLQWVHNLEWPGSKKWSQATRTPLHVNGFVQGYRKSFKNFAFYWINHAGHMVPSDNAEAAIELLRAITKFDQ